MIYIFFVSLVATVVAIVLVTENQEQAATIERQDATIARLTNEVAALNTTLSKRPAPVIILKRQGRFERMAEVN